MKNRPTILERAAKWTAIAALLLGAIMIVDQAARADERSPVRTILEILEPIPAPNFGFSRLAIEIPAQAEILGVEIVKPVSSSALDAWSAGSLRVIVAVEDSNPIVFRWIEIVEPPFPEIHPSDRVLDVQRGRVIFDAGDNSHPPPRSSR